MKKARTKQKETGTRWFVEPLDNTTNSVIADYLSAIGRSADESVCSSYPDEQGNLHQVWEITYPDITRMSVSARTANLKFRVYSMPLGARNIHEFPFANPQGRVRKSAPVRDMKKKLANLT